MKRRKLKVEIDQDLDITSLLDILVILVIFLIKTYSSSNIEFKVLSNLALPISTSTQVGQQASVLQVDRDLGVYIDGSRVGTLDPVENGDALAKVITEKFTPGEKRREVNIMVDKELTYEYVQYLMDLCSNIGLTKFRFVVEGVD